MLKKQKTSSTELQFLKPISDFYIQSVRRQVVTILFNSFEFIIMGYRIYKFNKRITQ